MQHIAVYDIKEISFENSILFDEIKRAGHKRVPKIQIWAWASGPIMGVLGDLLKVDVPINQRTCNKSV